MHAYGNEVARLLETSPNSTRWSWRKRRIRSRLRNLGRAAVSGLVGISSGLMRALHDSRRQLASRVIHQNRHLLHQDPGVGNAGLEPGQPDVAER